VTAWRDKEPPELVAAGHSVTEPAIQRLYRDYVVAIVGVVRSSHIGLAAETNRRQAELLDAADAAAVLQSTFTDLDIGARRRE
jgi:hypothetical protein